MDEKLKQLLSLISQAEGTAEYKGKDYDFNSEYDVPYNHGKYLTPSKPLTEMTLNEVLEYQRKVVNEQKKLGIPIKKRSSAMGKYQIITPTLISLRNKMGLSGDELFDSELQDEMAISLLKGRGYEKFLKGDITADDFYKNLSNEWASIGNWETGEGAYTEDDFNKASPISKNIKEHLGSWNSVTEQGASESGTVNRTDVSDIPAMTPKEFNPVDLSGYDTPPTPMNSPHYQVPVIGAKEPSMLATKGNKLDIPYGDNGDEMQQQAKASESNSYLGKDLSPFLNSPLGDNNIGLPGSTGSKSLGSGTTSMFSTEPSSDKPKEFTADDFGMKFIKSGAKLGLGMAGSGGDGQEDVASAAGSIADIAGAFIKTSKSLTPIGIGVNALNAGVNLASFISNLNKKGPEPVKADVDFDEISYNPLDVSPILANIDQSVASQVNLGKRVGRPEYEFAAIGNGLNAKNEAAINVVSRNADNRTQVDQYNSEGNFRADTTNKQIEQFNKQMEAQFDAQKSQAQAANLNNIFGSLTSSFNLLGSMYGNETTARLAAATMG